MRYFLHNLGAIWQAATTRNNVPRHNLYSGTSGGASDFGFEILDNRGTLDCVIVRWSFNEDAT